MGRKKIGSRGAGRGGAGRGKIVILSTSTSTEIPNHKTSKKNDISKQQSKQAIRQGKLRKITKCLLTVSITPGSHIYPK